MKYYVDIVYIMIVNGVIISNDKNKNILEKKIIKANGLSNVKTAFCPNLKNIIYNI